MQARSSLLFTNTRAQAELWHQALAAVWPEEPDTLALHHGSLDPALRQQWRTACARARCAAWLPPPASTWASTSPRLSRSCSWAARRAWRACASAPDAHATARVPAAPILCVPSHALELAEYAAVRRALAEGVVEARRPPTAVAGCAGPARGQPRTGGQLRQHCAAGTGPAYPCLRVARRRPVASRAHVHRAGRAGVGQYPDFHKVVRDADGWYRMHDRRQALRHRLSIGTISSDGSVRVQFLRGGGLGAVEEQFASRLRRGDRFQFAGRLLELVQLRDMTAFVRLARGAETVSCHAGRRPVAAVDATRTRAGWVLSGADDSAESRWLSPLLALQQQLSALPGGPPAGGRGAASRRPVPVRLSLCRPPRA